MAEKCAAHDLLIDEMKSTREDIRAFRLEFRSAVDSLVAQREDMASQKTHTGNIWAALGVVITTTVTVVGALACWVWAHISATGGK
jgi:hypothetical protein